MDRVINALLIVIAIASAFVWGWCAGGRHSKATISKTETTTDTLWREIHDTCFVERDVAVVRTDTVRLALANVPENAETGTFRPSNVPENGNSWTHRDGYGYENGISWTDVVCAENAPTTHDTLYVHDSVFVEVPITQRVFIGDNYVITAEGFRVRLTDVSITYPAVTSTVTSVSARKSRWGLGVQAGYGLSTKGLAPYIGIGVSYNILVW